MLLLACQDYPTEAEVSEDVASRQELTLPPFSFIDSSNNSNQWELQRLRREQDPLLTESSPEMNNKRSSLFDVGRETVHLAQAWRTFFFVFLATFTLVVLVQHILTDYMVYTKRHDRTVGTEQIIASCSRHLLYPWLNPVITRNLTSAKQEEYYRRVIQEKLQQRIQGPSGNKGELFCLIVSKIRLENSKQMQIIPLNFSWVRALMGILAGILFWGTAYGEKKLVS